MTQRAHIIGVAGIGMSGVALLLRQQGWEVSGSDEAFYPPASEILRHAGIAILSPHRPENLPAHADLIVIGKHAKLTIANPEVAAAFASGATIVSYPEVLKKMAAGREAVVVAGSYGKSTTASLIAWALQAGGKDPSYFIGAAPKNLAAHAGLGAGRLFILEGDEYPSSNTDATPKFLHYPVDMLLLTSAAHDHVNIYPTQADYSRPFATLLGRVPPHGFAVVCVDEPHAAALAKTAQCRIVTYNADDLPADYQARNIRYGETTAFEIHAYGRSLGSFTTTQLGRHMVQNMAGAAALLLERGALTADDLRAAFAAFDGVARRLDRLTRAGALPLYEGFGSSRDKARSAIEALRLHFPQRRLVAIFEPHTFSWRNHDTLHWYDDAFEGVSLLFVYPPPAHGAGGHAQVTLLDITERLRVVAKIDALPLSGNATENAASIMRVLRPDDVVLVLTSGDLGGLIRPLQEMIEKR